MPPEGVWSLPGLVTGLRSAPGQICEPVQGSVNTLWKDTHTLGGGKRHRGLPAPGPSLLPVSNLD